MNIERDGTLVAWQDEDGALTLVDLAPADSLLAPWTETCEGCLGRGCRHCSEGQVTFAYIVGGGLAATAVPPEAFKDPTERADAMTAAETSGGWAKRGRPEAPADAATAESVAPKGRVEAARADARHATHDGGGNPGSAPNAGAPA